MSTRALPRDEVEVHIMNAFQRMVDASGITLLEVAHRTGIKRERTRRLFNCDARLTFYDFERLCDCFGANGWRLLRDAEQKATTQRKKV